MQEADLRPVCDMVKKTAHLSDEFRSGCQMLISDEPHLAMNHVRHLAINLHRSLGNLIGMLNEVDPAGSRRPTPQKENPVKLWQTEVNLKSVTCVNPDRQTKMLPPAVSFSHKSTSSTVTVKKMNKEEFVPTQDSISLPSFPSLCSSLSSSFQSTTCSSSSFISSSASLLSAASSGSSTVQNGNSFSPRRGQAGSWSWAISSSSEPSPTKVTSVTSPLHISPSWPPPSAHSYTSLSLNQIRSPPPHADHSGGVSIPTLPQIYTNLAALTSSCGQTSVAPPGTPVLKSLVDEDCNEVTITEKDCLHEGSINMSRKRIFRKINSMVLPKKKKMEDSLICTNCGSTTTPQWRKGPDGKPSLCNACGIHYASQKKKILYKCKR